MKHSHISNIISISAGLCLPALLIIVFLQGCGKKTTPIPPHAIVPTAITDLRFHQQDDTMILSWTQPTATTASTPLERIEAFELLESESQKDNCRTCPLHFNTAFPINDERSIRQQHKPIFFTKTGLNPGSRYSYKVLTKAGWRRVSSDSNIVSFEWATPPNAPKSLFVTPGDKSATLAWSRVSLDTAGQIIDQPLSYQVFRQTEETSLKPVGQPTTALNFKDIALTNDRKHLYTVKTVRELDTNSIFSAASTTASAIPQDMAAPLPPRGLTVVTVQGGAKLLWQMNIEKDIAGYKIFRRRHSEKEKSLVAEIKGIQSYYIDHDIAPNGGDIFYSITAFDQTTPANESLHSREIRYEPF